ncbi:MAG TPA: caspase family protein [Ohtaekwangia sp.]|uniref:caspase family protein n=1 Tax=Ohtaekwangia sp. TaxID=2066019 RepID=UPI002F935C7D
MWKCGAFILLLGLASLTCEAQFKLYEKGHDSYTAGKYEDAIRNFSEYLTKYTRDKSLDVEVYYLRALAYYKSNNFKDAVPDFEESLLLGHANTGNIYWFKAKCQAKNGLDKEAISDYSIAIRELGEDKTAKSKLLYERGLLYSKTGNLVAAKEDFQNGLLINPDNEDLKREFGKLGNVTITARSTTETPSSTSQSVVKKEDIKTKKEEPVVANSTPPPVSVEPTMAEFYKDEKRYALVIGNAAYPKNIGSLKNPVNDATDMARELENSNFQVDLLINATYGQMRAALLKFKDRIEASDPEKTVALFYFAGHGLQHEQENYLVPIDAAVEFEDDISRYCFPAQRMVLANMERSNVRMNILILDACRNNPFPALNRSIDQGLGEMRRARGSFIAYATAPGSVASDGNGRNGLYTQELIKSMRKPGLTIEQVFKDVRANVLRLSGDRQNTWDSSNIIGEFYFKFK